MNHHMIHYMNLITGLLPSLPSDVLTGLVLLPYCFHTVSHHDALSIMMKVRLSTGNLQLSSFHGEKHVPELQETSVEFTHTGWG